MGNNYYEKRTFKTFIILILTMFLVPLFLNAGISSMLKEEIIVKMVLIYMALVVIVISYIVYKKERVYWISSYSYEDACSMTSKERKEISFKLFKVVGICFGILILYLAIGIFINTSWLIDIIVFTILSIIACVKS